MSKALLVGFDGATLDIAQPFIKTLWQLLDEAKKTSIVADAPYTYPPPVSSWYHDHPTPTRFY